VGCKDELRDDPETKEFLARTTRRASTRERCERRPQCLTSSLLKSLQGNIDVDQDWGRDIRRMFSNEEPQCARSVPTSHESGDEQRVYTLDGGAETEIVAGQIVAGVEISRGVDGRGRGFDVHETDSGNSKFKIFDSN
jgi:hypothetical protein